MARHKTTSRRNHPPVTPTALQLMIALDEVEPRVWRRIRMPTSSTFWDLHVAIQAAMGWDDCHLHEFFVTTAASAAPVAIGVPSDEDDDDAPVYAGWEVPVALAFRTPGDKAAYHYDFGDDWIHTVILEEIVTTGRAIQRPTCVAGERACPPEDCGGPHRYAQLLHVLADRDHDDHDETKESLPRGFDPDRFDPKRVRFDDPVKRLQNLLE